MARYTSTIYDILRNEVEKNGLTYDGLQDLIEKGRPFLFDFDYPFYDNNFKPQFEREFCIYFMMREIGMETREFWKVRLQNHFNMFHQKYSLIFQNFNSETRWLENYNFVRENNLDESQNQKSHSEDTANTNIDQAQNTRMSGQSTMATTNSQKGFDRSLSQDTPDTRLNITANDGQGLIQFASGITENRSTAHGNAGQNANSSSNMDFTDQTENRNQAQRDLESEREINQKFREESHGKNTPQTYLELYQAFSYAFYGLHQTIFREMEQLFMGVLN